MAWSRFSARAPLSVSPPGPALSHAPPSPSNSHMADFILITLLALALLLVFFSGGPVVWERKV